MVIAGRKLVSGPFGEPTLRTRSRSMKLRMFQERFHRIHVGIGDCGILEPPDHLLGGEVGKMPLDQRLQCVAILHALRIAAEARVARKRGISSTFEQSAIHSRSF